MVFRRFTSIFISLPIFLLLFGCASTGNPVKLDSGIETMGRQITESMRQGEIESIAILDFSDLDGNVDQFGRYLSEGLIYHIFQVPGLTVAERNQLSNVLGELELQNSGLIDSDSMKELGKILGVDALLLGTVTDMGDSVEINGRIVNTETTSIVAVTSVEIIKEGKVANLSGEIISDSEPEKEEAPGHDKPEKDTGAVRIFVTLNDFEQEMFRLCFSDFEAETGIAVELIQGGDPWELRNMFAEGDKPDAALITDPNLFYEIIYNGEAIDLNQWFDRNDLEQQYKPTWIELCTGQVDNGTEILGGLCFRAGLKGLVWYPKEEWEKRGYPVPDTWDELMDISWMISVSGISPWMVHLESGDVSGWPGTDWIENILLRTSSPEVYDRWTSGDLPFKSHEVKEAFRITGDIWFDESLTYGDIEYSISTSFSEMEPLLSDPPGAWMYMQGHYMSGFLPDNGNEIENNEIGFFLLPSINDRYGRPAEVIADFITPLSDRPEVRQLMEYLIDPESVQEWIRTGGLITPHRNIPSEWYSSAEAVQMAEILREVDTVRLDASDLMPGEIGFHTFFNAMMRFAESKGEDLDEILESLDSAWPR